MRRWRKIMYNRWLHQEIILIRKRAIAKINHKKFIKHYKCKFWITVITASKDQSTAFPQHNIYIECKESKAWSQSMLNFSFSHCDLSIAIESVPVSKAASLSSVTSRKRIHEATNNSQLWSILTKLILWFANKICDHLIYRVSV